MKTGSILLVDDEPHARRLVSLQLERRGHVVEEASDGALALEKIRSGRFDVVVTDVNMPSLNGRELCAQIAEEFGSGGPLVLVLTGLPEEDCSSWVEELPNTELVHKPVSVRGLLRRVSEHLRGEDGGEAAP